MVMVFRILFGQRFYIIYQLFSFLVMFTVSPWLTRCKTGEQNEHEHFSSELSIAESATIIRAPFHLFVFILLHSAVLIRHQSRMPVHLSLPHLITLLDYCCFMPTAAYCPCLSL
uniref:Putative secreted peptide n=1 Tax=Anopheles braziliensis TaxID=58242 RepID=A0A2M3ZQK4_9DIPT